VNRIVFFLLIICLSCQNEDQLESNPQEDDSSSKAVQAAPSVSIKLDLKEAERLAKLPFACIDQDMPYKSGIVLSGEKDLAMPRVHHPAFYGCFDWHSAVHGHWSLIYLMKEFPELSITNQVKEKISNNLTKENILTEIDYFSLNRYTASFERTYGWAWLLKLAEELHNWEDEDAQIWYQNLKPLVDLISNSYQEYLPKLVYPIRVGEHTNTAFGLSFAWDYSIAVGDTSLQNSIKIAALRFYKDDAGCPIAWEPSGYDFLSPCLQEMDIMRKVLSPSEFNIWKNEFLPKLFDGTLNLEPGQILDRSDGKLVHLDGLNFSRAWCLYGLSDEPHIRSLADQHLAYSLEKMVDGDYAGQHWLASFALYAYKCKK